MNYDFIAIPDQDVPHAADPALPAPHCHLRQRDQQDRQHVAGDPRRSSCDFKPHEKVNTDPCRSSSTRSSPSGGSSPSSSAPRDPPV